MSSPIFPTPDRDTQAMLDSLRQTAAKTLDRKRRLGQFAVIWRNNAPALLGEDAPVESLAPQPADSGFKVRKCPCNASKLSLAALLAAAG